MIETVHWNHKRMMKRVAKIYDFDQDIIENTRKIICRGSHEAVLHVESPESNLAVQPHCQSTTKSQYIDTI